MKQFDRNVVKAVSEAKEELSPFLKRLDIGKISKHNCGYKKYAQDPVKFFIDGEIIRYFHTVNYIYSFFPKSAMILDVGFFIPVIPIALSKLGFNVSSLEKLSYYNGALDEIITFSAEKYNIRVIDFNLFLDDVSGLKQKFDIILLLAVLEHLNGTPKYILDKMRSMVKSDGRLIVEVPNISSLTKRVCFLKKGKWNSPAFDDYFNSEYPFSGHNREYSMSDLKYALDCTGFEIIEMKTFHHSVLKLPNMFLKILYCFELIGPPSWKPNIWAVAKPGKSYSGYDKNKI